MSRYILLFLFYCIVLSSAAQKVDRPGVGFLTEGAGILFKNVKTKILNDDKNFLFKQTGLSLAPDKKSFLIGEFPVEVSVYPTDMNNDGKEEIFIGMSSTALYGNVGVNYYLFIKNATGAYNLQKEVMGGIPILFDSKNLGYNDIMVGGPGFEFPVYRWNGTKYLWYKKVKDASLAKIKSTDLEAFSKRYTGKL